MQAILLPAIQWKPTIATIYGGAILAVGLVTFFAYGIDKRRAVHDKRRIPERKLHWMSLLGGWLGAFAGQQVFRHKTRKLSFQIVYWLTVLPHLLLIGVVCYAWFG